MEQYMSKTRTDYGSGVARPKIDNKDQFELKGQFLKELRENTFSGSDNEDANEHIEKVLEIVDLFHVPNITVDQLMLRVFPISLTGAASRWLRNEPTGSIKTWEDLKTKFLNKYCPPGRTAKKMEEINNFQQEPDETLYQAWERFKELLMKCPQHYLTEMQEVILFYNGLDVPTRWILDSRGVVPTKTAADAKKAIQEMVEYSQKWHNETCRGRSTETSTTGWAHTSTTEQSGERDQEIEYGVSTSTGYGVSSSLSNTTYSSQQINTAYFSVRMTKVIKGEFKKIKDIKAEDDSLACDLPLDVFNCKVGQLSRMDDNLFTYEVEIANILCDLRVDDDSEHEADDMGFDPSDISFTEWLGSKFFNYKTIDHYTMKALWIYWIRGDDKVELTDEEFSDNEDEIAEAFRIDTNIFDYETPIYSAFNEFNYLLKVDSDLLTKDIVGFKTYDDYKDDWIYEWNKDIPWVDEKPWTDTRVWIELKPVIHTCKPFNYKTRCLEWPTCSWMNDGYCNGGNLPGTFIIENQLHYQDYKWYEALENSELKDEALRNKAIMEGFIKDDDDESIHEPSICTIQRFEMIKYSFGLGEEYVAIKEDEYDDLARTSNNACRTYQEIFRMMDEGWMVTRAE
ncbi:VIER F-box protein 2 [Tanacetum coccineum]|uniref:VIER F-box protein 2 n=1 Tax=Tanacetum coccineum TaxID=301880 RepID=A0ABQ5GBM2_9ASTR